MTAVLIYTAKVRIPEFAILDPCLRVSDVGGTVLPQKHSQTSGRVCIMVMTYSPKAFIIKNITTLIKKDANEFFYVYYIIIILSSFVKYI